MPRVIAVIVSFSMAAPAWSAETTDTSLTETDDTADTADTGDTDDTDDTDVLDTAPIDTGPTFAAADLAGERGGSACSGVGVVPIGLVPLLILAAFTRRRLD